MLKSAKKLKEKDKVDIRIYGDGFELDKLKKYKKENNIKHVTFYGKVSKNKIFKAYVNTDALFLSLAKDKFLNFTVPAKLQSYLSIGKPIIASASGETKNSYIFKSWLLLTPQVMNICYIKIFLN